MKILLTSVFANVADQLEKILPDKPENLKVIFIPTAADVYENKWFVEKDRKKLEEMGFKIFDLPLKDATPEIVGQALAGADIIFVAGGNTFYLLDQAKKSGFDEKIIALADKDIIYIGSSAGSYIACPTIEVADWEFQDENSVGLKDLSALSLVLFFVSVHYDPKQKESLLRDSASLDYPLKILTDDQALLIENGNMKFLGEGEEIKL